VHIRLLDKDLAMFCKPIVLNVLIISVLSSSALQAAEWKLEPSVGIRTQYNDNVGLRTEANNPVGSTGYTLDPKIKLAAEEQNLWNLSLSTRGKVTRYQDLRDADSDNVYVDLGSGWQTERVMLRFNASLTRNTNFDDDYDTESPLAGLTDDKTKRKTITFSPSVRWNWSQTSVAIFSINTTDISYDEVISTNLRDYTNDSVSFQAYWQVFERHSLGYTVSYSEQETPEVNYSSDTTVLNIDYTYNLNQRSDLKFSLGGRSVDSFSASRFIGCTFTDAFGSTFVPAGSETSCPVIPFIIVIPEFTEDVRSKDNGLVINLSYSNQTERVSNIFNVARNIIPSSTGSTQEQRSVNYKFSFKNTERFTSSLLLDGSEAETIGGGDSSYDRTRYRIEPSIYYKLSRDWGLSFKYSYINQNLTNTDQDSTSNAVYINLLLNWPKLATTY